MPVTHEGSAVARLLAERAISDQLFDADRPRLQARLRLFYFRFFEFNVLAYDRVVLLHYKLFRGVAGVLLGYIEEPGSSGRQQLYFLYNGLGHDRLQSLEC